MEHDITKHWWLETNETNAFPEDLGEKFEGKGCEGSALGKRNRTECDLRHWERKLLSIEWSERLVRLLYFILFYFLGREVVPCFKKFHMAYQLAENSINCTLNGSFFSLS